MNIIQKLPMSLCNQIAAGEVVERPANVIKELMENSLDAGADSIYIELEQGGLQKILIRDNGIGIEAEYLTTALERYTTSKITCFEDMYGLHTFGFRGEALASIASVSNVTLSSASKIPSGERKESAYVTVSYGVVKEKGLSLPVDGTSIIIENLFFNVPARLQFLKNPSTEQKKCIEVFLRIALLHLKTEFILTVGGRKLYHFTKNQSLEERIEALFPSELSRHLIPLNSTYNNFHITGLCSSPAVTQKRTDKILLYVNNRTVSDRLLLRAVRQGYQEYLTTKEYPCGVFFITLPPDEIDVNVHPTKSEVRFLDESTCIKAIVLALRSALQYYSEGTLKEGNSFTPLLSSHNLSINNTEPHQSKYSEDIHNMASSQMPSSDTLPIHNTELYRNKYSQNNYTISDNYLQNMAESSDNNTNNTLWTYSKNRIIEKSLVEENSPAQYGIYNLKENECITEQPLHSPLMPYSEYVNNPNNIQNQSYSSTQSNIHSSMNEYPITQKNRIDSSSITEHYAFITVIDTTYLVFLYLEKNEILIIDQHAAHERVLEEYITRNAVANVQYLSEPLTMSLHPQEEERLLEILPVLLNLGFVMKYNNALLVIEAIPSYIPRMKVFSYIKDLLLDISDDSMQIIHKKACTNAIKKGDILTAEDAYALLSQWMSIPNNTHCPHGRPICLNVDATLLEYLFKRKV